MTRRHLCMLFLPILLAGCSAPPEGPRRFNGLTIDEPLPFMKQTFLLLGADQANAAAIDAVRNPVSRFVFELSTYGTPGPQTTLSLVPPQTLPVLRLPPQDERGWRYVASRIYGWRMGPDEVEFTVDWYHVSQRDSYTDSYVLKRSGERWVFVRHGVTGPIRWQREGR